MTVLECTIVVTCEGGYYSARAFFPSGRGDDALDVEGTGDTPRQALEELLQELSTHPGGLRPDE